MIYYFSAPTSPGFSPKCLKEAGAKNYLLSFAVDAKGKWQDFCTDDNTVIIDSGAFSAWNKGKSININEYLKFCQKLPDTCIFVNLDVIPKTGSSATDVEVCASKGYENFLFLSKHLKHVLPVYHYKDDLKWLYKYMDHTDYIGVSPANDTDESVKQKYLDYVFKEIKTSVKTHAFGYTPGKGLRKYPFYSVDSTSWKTACRFGTVIRYNKIKFDLEAIDISMFAKMAGIEYSKQERISPYLMEEGIKFSIQNIIEFMADITEYHSKKDFTYLSAQKTLF